MLNRRTGCKATQTNDQMQCGQCGLAWDTTDPDLPECRTKEFHSNQKGFNAVQNMKRILK